MRLVLSNVNLYRPGQLRVFDNLMSASSLSHRRPPLPLMSFLSLDESSSL